MLPHRLYITCTPPFAPHHPFPSHHTLPQGQRHATPAHICSHFRKRAMHSLGATSTPEPPEQNTDRMRAISACRASRYDCSCKRMKRLRDWESRIRRGTALFGVATRFSMAMSVPAMERTGVRERTSFDWRPNDWAMRCPTGGSEAPSSRPCGMAKLNTASTLSVHRWKERVRGQVGGEAHRRVRRHV